VKSVGLKDADLNQCVDHAQREHVVLTRGGKPIAVLVGVKGLDWEQVELGYSDDFWELIRARRREKAISREELERRLAKSPTRPNHERTDRARRRRK
jgi:antitoxin (DNA-binding transcriptional repressor) of toxin-antitoxin stability system